MWMGNRNGRLLRDVHVGGVMGGLGIERMDRLVGERLVDRQAGRWVDRSVG